MFKDIHALDEPPPHPGDILREDLIPRLGLTRAELARHLGIPRRVLADLIAERRPVTLDLARRLGQAFNNGTHFWLGLQMQHDLWHARREDPAPRIAPLAWPARRRARGTAGTMAASAT
jgi:addiction module HigA family antidote